MKHIFLSFVKVLLFVTLRTIYKFTSEWSPSPVFSISFVGLKIRDIALTQPWSTMLLTPEEELIRNVHGSRIKKKITVKIPKIPVVGLLLFPLKIKLIAKVMQPVNSTDQAMEFILAFIWHIWARLFLWDFDNESIALDLIKFLKCIIEIFYFKIWKWCQFS